MASRIWLYYVGAGATFIAGVLHLTLVPNVIDRNLGTAMLFLIGGIAQYFGLYQQSEDGEKCGITLVLQVPSC
jgi:hypothetical protein